MISADTSWPSLIENSPQSFEQDLGAHHERLSPACEENPAKLFLVRHKYPANCGIFQHSPVHIQRRIRRECGSPRSRLQWVACAETACPTASRFSMSLAGAPTKSF